MSNGSHRPQGIKAFAVVALVPWVVLLSACSSQPSPVPTEPSAAGSSLEQQLDSYWQSVTASHPNAVRPVVPVVRLVTPSELMPTLESCMHEQGWPDVRATDDGGLESGSIPTSQAEVYDLALYTCKASYPLEERFTQPFSADQIIDLYDYLTDEAVPCLEKLGYTVSPPSSKEEYVDRYLAGTAWDPFAEASESVASNEEWTKLVTTCPQVPDDILG